jgi:UDP-N-acetylglucosamine transferase subunit ALG13
MKDALNLNAEKLFLVSFNFVSGEYEQPFVKLFYAKDEKEIEQKAHEYLIGYYGEGNTSEVEGDKYYYWHNEVTVELNAWEEIRSFKQLVNRLL